MQTRKHTEIIRELLPPRGKRVLDVGCGDGALTRFLAREGATATGIDISEKTLARARAAEPVPGADYAVGFGEKLPNPDGSVDAVLYMNALHHVPMKMIDAAIVEAARVLRQDGHLLVIEPLAEGPNFELSRLVDDETEVRAAAYSAVKAAASARFSMKSEEFYDAPIRSDNFAAFEARMRAVDPARGPRLEKNRAELIAKFERLGRREADGIWFSQPTRANLLVRA